MGNKEKWEYENNPECCLNEALFHFLESIYFFEKQEKKCFGLDWNEVYLLQLVFRNPGIKMSDLAKQMKEEKFVISRMVKKMEMSGMIRRETGKEDRRISFLYITDQGILLRDSLEEYNGKIVQSRLGLMSQEQGEFVISMLQNMGELLGVNSEVRI